MQYREYLSVLSFLHVILVLGSERWRDATGQEIFKFQCVKNSIFFYKVLLQLCDSQVTNYNRKYDFAKPVESQNWRVLWWDSETPL